jgi:hypothetical protein
LANFTVHDERGRILQSNTVYDPKGYEDRLHEHGHSSFVRVDANRTHHPERHFVDGAKLRARPEMRPYISATSIKAGSAVGVAGLYSGSVLSVSTGGLEIERVTVQSHRIFIPLPVPGVYTIAVEKWPHRRFQINVTAV